MGGLECGGWLAAAWAAVVLAHVAVYQAQEHGRAALGALAAVRCAVCGARRYALHGSPSRLVGPGTRPCRRVGSRLVVNLHCDFELRSHCLGVEPFYFGCDLGGEGVPVYAGQGCDGFLDGLCPGVGIAGLAQG